MSADNWLVLQPDKHDEFFDKLNALLAEYPEMLAGMERVYEDQDPLDPEDNGRILMNGGDFDPASPTYFTGIVLLATVANVQGYETTFRMTPRMQSVYLSDGIVANAWRRI